MRVLLKTRGTDLYYRDAGELTANPDQALEFPSVAAAAKLALVQTLTETEIALRCDYLDTEIALPILPELCGLQDGCPLPVGHAEPPGNRAVPPPSMHV